jgi:hypothetical protein
MQILGSAITDVPLPLRREAYRQLTEQAARGTIRVDTIRAPLAKVAQAWAQQKSGAPAKQVPVLLP